MLRPDRVRRVLDYYWEKNGKPSREGPIPSLSTIDLAGSLLSLARQIGGLSDEELDELDEIGAALERHRRDHNTMTRKNREVVLLVVQDNTWRKVAQLPGQLMERARVQRADAPYRAAVTAELAIAIRILLRAPARIANLAAIRLDQHLFRRGGRNGCFHLHFDGHEVKNGEELDFELDARTTAMIDEYIRLHRPELMHGHQHDWLFPSTDPARPKGAQDLSEQMTRRLWKELGLRITPHQFRHAAAAIMLKVDPGNLEWVRRVLGHTSTRTTARFYAFLDGLEASRRYGAILSDLEGRDGHA